MGVIFEQVRDRLRECVNSSEDLIELLERNPDYIICLDKPGLRVAINNLNKILDLVNNPPEVEENDEGL